MNLDKLIEDVYGFYTEYTDESLSGCDCWGIGCDHNTEQEDDETH